MSTDRSVVVLDLATSPHAKLQGVGVNRVTLSDSVWAPRIANNRARTIPHQYEQCEQTGRIDNFRITSGRKPGEYKGHHFHDSDVYKWIEAASYSLAARLDGDLDRLLDALADDIAAAQEPDGYLNTHFHGPRAAKRFTNLSSMHELYCAGHFIQAAVAHLRATGKRTMLDIATRLADHICRVFGPASQGKKETSDGHEEIEMAMVELYRATGQRRYLDQARFFIDVRGYDKVGGKDYQQDDVPVRDMRRLTGHAVRAVYYMCGVADVLAETGEPALRAALDRIWENMVSRQMYLTGGIGCRWGGETFGRDFEVPSERAYAESCAAVGSVMWAQRMLALDGNARYADLIERTLHNAVISGLSLSGDLYFYQNPLADDGTHRRQPWFGCACCPPNIARLLEYLPGMFYSTAERSVYVHLYAQGTASLELDGRPIEVRQDTQYPWSGTIKLTVNAEGTFALRLRIPGWCGGAKVDVNGKPTDATPTAGEYFTIDRNWRRGDAVTLDLPMPARWVASHPYALENSDRLALMRGPIVYCVEGIDQPGVEVRDLRVDPAAPIEVLDFKPELLGGVTPIRFDAVVTPPRKAFDHAMYLDASAERHDLPVRRAAITAIPYFAWANRESCRMQVWLAKL